MNPLKKNYPVYTNSYQILLSSTLIAGLVYFFLAIFQPFGTYNFQHSQKYMLLIPYAAFALIGFFSGDVIVYLKKWPWTWKREYIKCIAILTASALANYVYHATVINPSSFNGLALFNMFVFTYLLGVPICIVYIFGKYTFLVNSNDKKNETTKTNNQDKELCITPNIGDALKINAQDLLFLESDGNYSTVYFTENGSICKVLIRITLKNAESQICDNTIVRCHRSFIVNLHKAVEIKGNAQGLKITLESTSTRVPVSRKYVHSINRLVNTS